MREQINENQKIPGSPPGQPFKKSLFQSIVGFVGRLFLFYEMAETNSKPRKVSFLQLFIRMLGTSATNTRVGGALKHIVEIPEKGDHTSTH